MTSLPRALALSIAQLGDRAILRVLAKSAGLTLAIFAGLGAALGKGRFFPTFTPFQRFQR